MQLKITCFFRRCFGALLRRCKGWALPSFGLAACVMTLAAMLCVNRGGGSPGTSLCYAVSSSPAGQELPEVSSVPAQAGVPAKAAALRRTKASADISTPADTVSSSPAAFSSVQSSFSSGHGSSAAKGSSSRSSPKCSSSKTASSSKRSKAGSSSKGPSSSKGASGSSSRAKSSSGSGSSGGAASGPSENQITDANTIATFTNAAVNELTGRTYICFRFSNTVDSQIFAGKTYYCPGIAAFLTTYTKSPMEFPTACYCDGTAIWLRVFVNGGKIGCKQKPVCTEADLVTYMGLLPQKVSASQIISPSCKLLADGTGTVNAALPQGVQESDVQFLLGDNKAQVLSEDMTFTLNAGVLTSVTQQFSAVSDGKNVKLTLQKDFYVPADDFIIPVPNFAK